MLNSNDKDKKSIFSASIDERLHIGELVQVWETDDVWCYAQVEQVTYSTRNILFIDAVKIKP